MASPYRDPSPPRCDEDQALDAYAEVSRARHHFRQLQRGMALFLLVDGLIVLLLRGFHEGLLGSICRGALAAGAAVALVGLCVSVEELRARREQRRQFRALPFHLRRRVDR